MAAQRKELVRHISLDAKNTKNYTTGSEATACGPQVTVDTDTDLNTCSSTNEMHKYVDLINYPPDSQHFDGTLICPNGLIYSLSTEDDTDRFILANRVRQKSATGEPEDESSPSRFQSSSRGNLRLCLLSDEIFSSCRSSTAVLSMSMGLNSASCKDSGQQAEMAEDAIYEVSAVENSEKSINTGSEVPLSSEPTTADAMWKFRCEPDQPIAMQPAKHSTIPSGIGIWKFRSETNKAIAMQPDNELPTSDAIDKSMTLADTTAESTLLKSTSNTDDSALIVNDKNWSLSLSKAANGPIDTRNDDDGTKASRRQILVEVSAAVLQTVDSDIGNLPSQDLISHSHSGAVEQSLTVTCLSGQLQMQEAASLSNLVCNAETITAPNSLEAVNSQMGALTQLPLASSFITIKQSQGLDSTETSSASKIVWGVSDETSRSLRSKRSNSVQDDSQSIYVILSQIKRGSGQKNMFSDQKAAVRKNRSQTTGPPPDSDRRDVAQKLSRPSHRDSINALSHHSIWRKQQPSNSLSDVNPENSPLYHRDNSPTPEATRSSYSLRFGLKTSSEALNQNSKSESNESDSHSELATTRDTRKSQMDKKSSKTRIPECPGNSQPSKKRGGFDTAKTSSKSTAHVVKHDQNVHTRNSTRSKKHADQNLTTGESFDLKPSKPWCPMLGSNKVKRAQTSSARLASNKVRSITWDTLEKPRSREKISEVLEPIQPDNSKPVGLPEISKDETSNCRDFTSGSTNAELITRKRSKRTSKSLPRELNTDALKSPNSIHQDVALKSFNNRKPNGGAIKLGRDVIKPTVSRRSSSRKKSTDAGIRDGTSYSTGQDLSQSRDARNPKLNALVEVMRQPRASEQTGVVLITSGSTSVPIRVADSDSQRLTVDGGFTPSRQMLQALQKNTLQIRLNLRQLPRRLRGAVDATSTAMDPSSAGQWGDLALALSDQEL